MKLRITMFISAGLMATGIASAATTSNTLNVSTNVGTNATCSITATNAISFPWVDNQTDTNANGDVTVDCGTTSVAYRIGLDAGLYYNATTGDRGEVDSTNLPSIAIPYNLYTDANFTQVWGDDGATIQAPSVPLVSNGVPTISTIYGQQLASILGQGSVVPSNGTYTDVVNVIVTY